MSKRYETIEDYIKDYIKDYKKEINAAAEFGLFPKKEAKTMILTLENIEFNLKKINNCALLMICKNYGRYFCSGINNFDCCKHLNIIYKSKVKVEEIEDILKKLYNDFKKKEKQEREYVRESLKEHKKEMKGYYEGYYEKEWLRLKRSKLVFIQSQIKNINSLLQNK